MSYSGVVFRIGKNSKIDIGMLPLTSEWTDKIWYINIMEYYLAIEKGNSDNLMS